MRFLSFHVDYFWYKVTKRGRSKLFEELETIQREKRVENAVVLFTSVEKQDEVNTELINKSLIEIEKILKQLKILNVVILPFAHLFGELSSPKFGLETLKTIELELKKKRLFNDSSPVWLVS